MPAPVPEPMPAPAPVRARGEVKLSVVAAGSGARLDGLRQAGSLKCLFPRRVGGTLQAVLVNTAGGVTGGDRFATTARAEPGAHLTMTTQAAERAYRARDGELAQVRTQLSIAPGARLNWLPQETILFDGCAVNRSLTIDLEAGDPEVGDPEVGASLLMCEPLVFGREAMGETVRTGLFRDRIEIRRAGAPLYLDAALWSGDMQARLDRPGVADGARAMAGLVYVAADAQARLDPLRALLPETGGASLLADDMLVLRLIAPDSYALRKALIPILTLLNPEGLPRCWTL